jgi:RNA polymerase sigma-70 factor (ECF subfamily)
VNTAFGKSDQMQSATQTTSMLLEQLRSTENTEVWQELDARYRSVIIGFGRRAGLSQDDAEDAAQETLLRFVKYYQQGAYDRSRGRLRAWMAGIAQNCISDQHRARAARREHGTSQIGDLALDPGQTEVCWNEECERAIVDRALRELHESTRIDPRTLQAFKLVAFSQRSAVDVAKELGMRLDSVYAAKHRCTAQLRQIVGRLKQAYELE